MLAHPCTEDREVAAIGLCVISRRYAVRRCERRLVHELDCCDRTAERLREEEKMLRLIGRPVAVCIALAPADRKRRYDLRVERARKVADAAPLYAAQHG